MRHTNICRRWCAALLALVLCMSMLSVAALAVEGEEAAEEAATEEQPVIQGNATVDFVLVLDCSGSLEQTDPYYLCATACKMFLDMVPLENSRIGIVAFGYAGDNSYTLQNLTIDNPKDLEKVHLISPLEEATAMRAKEDIKNIVDSAVRAAGDKTPIGTATMAAVDLLISNNSADNNACVILLTDGDVTADYNFVSDKENAYAAADIAKEHQWPIYTMQLNNGMRNKENSEETIRMKTIAERSGAKDGHCQLTDFTEGNTEVANAFLSIFNHFMFGGNGNVNTKTADENGMVESVVDIPNLTSESTVVVSGQSLKKIEVVDPTGNSREINGNIDEKNLVATAVPGSYICAKLICPQPGKWTIRAFGDPDATISMYDCSMKDFDMVLTYDVTDTEKEMKKSEVVNFSSYFAYHGIEILTNEYYQQKQPKLVLTNVNTGKKYEFQMDASDTGYSYTLPLSEISAGTFKAEARLDDSMFRNGSKYSNALTVKTENLPIEIVNAQMEDLSGYVNTKIEGIDLNQYIANPDNDDLYLKLDCLSDRTMEFKVEVNEDDYMSIECGLLPGEYEVQLSVKDVDMPEYLKLDPFMIKVEDRTFTFDRIPAVELWVDSFFFQKDAVKSATIDLSEYYNDPDGMDAVYGELVCDEMGTVFACEQNGTVLTLTPLAKGSSKITFTVSDGTSTSDESLTVKVVSGKGIFYEKVGIYVLIAAIVIVIAVLIAIIISKNTRVKGTWMMTMQNAQGFTSQWEQPLDMTMLKIGKKKKFTLGELLNVTGQSGLNLFENNSALEEVGAVLAANADVRNILLKGVVAGKGCKLQNVPSSATVEVVCNGRPISGKAKMSTGSLTITVGQVGTEERVRLMMELVNNR